MALNKIASAPSAQPSLPSAKEEFKGVLADVTGGRTAQAPGPQAARPSAGAARPALPALSRAGQAAASVPARGPATASSQVSTASPATARGIDAVSQAQHRLDHILQLAQSGRTFTPAELLAMQANVYQASQQLELAGKLVDKATSGIKQVLQTQL